MPFNSAAFVVFLPIAFFLYWFVFRERKVQNIFIIVASYVFYGWWNWRCIFLIAFTTLCCYISGILIEKYGEAGEKKKAKAVNVINIVINLSILGYFKYFNFFVSSLVCAAGLVGWHIDSLTADILLPVGISFYTFQAIGYSIDVFKKRIPASHDPVSFFAYVCFFPQLVAGPIERARNLLPQFGKARIFDYSQAMDGSRQMLWGFFKKLVIADRCAMLADSIFRSPSNYSGIDSGIGLILFFFQIYGDFSGYSDIAIGTAKLFGIRLTRNFNAPMYSRNIAEFWRRWHISLNSWFFDYVFSAMKGWNRKWRVALNVLIVFMLSGFWHGASVKFILWGLYFGVLSIPFFIKIKPLPTVEVAGGRLIPSLKEFFQMMSTFILVLLAEPFFRCQSVKDALIYYKSLVTDFSLDISIPVGFALPGFICLLLILEWIFRGREYPFQVGLIRNTACRYAIVIIMLLFIYFHCAISPSNFIYFDF